MCSQKFDGFYLLKCYVRIHEYYPSNLTPKYVEVYWADPTKECAKKHFDPPLVLQDMRRKASTSLSESLA